MRSPVRLGVTLAVLSVAFVGVQAADESPERPRTRSWTYFVDSGEALLPFSVDADFVESTLWDLSSGPTDIVVSLSHSGQGYRLIEERRDVDGAPLGTASVHYIVRERSEALGGPRAGAEFPGPAHLVLVEGLTHAEPGSVFHESYVEVKATEDGTVRTAYQVTYEILRHGRVTTPRGQHDAVLIREQVASRVQGAGQPTVEYFQYRWLNRAFGTLALVRGAEGVEEPYFDTALSVARRADAATAGVEFRFFAEDFPSDIHGSITYGRNIGVGGAVSAVTATGGITTIETLLDSGPSWDLTMPGVSDFSVAVTTREPLTASCHASNVNFPRCGFSNPDTDALFLLATKNLPNESLPDGSINHSGLAFDGEKEFFLRFAVIDENGDSGGDLGENRVCFDPTDAEFNPLPQGRDRSEVPYMSFQNFDADAGKWYMLPGDTWGNDILTDCEAGLWQLGFCDDTAEANAGVNFGGSSGPPIPPPNNLCGEAIPGDHTGQIFYTALEIGEVTLPSGHIFDTILVENFFDFLVSIDSGCILNALDVRRYTYFWLVPKIGFVANVGGAFCTPDGTSWSEVDATDISAGLFPPLSITGTPGGDGDSCVVDWDPGSDESFIDGYKVYWNTASGADEPYAFNSEDDAGQVAFDGTSATVSGLGEGTFYMTVTAQSTYVPDWRGTFNETVEYESLLFPEQITGGGTVYPVEVTCVNCPALPAVGNTVGAALPNGQAEPNDVDLSWEAAEIGPSCLSEYLALWASDPSDPLNFVEACRSGDAATTSCTVADGDRVQPDPPADPMGPICTEGCQLAEFYRVVTVGTDGGEGPLS